MFLDEKDIYNFDNYFKISHYGMPFGYATVDRSILGLIVNNPNFINAPITDLSDKCVRCAVVGCGGILNGSNTGQEIDSHDFVFRVNHALTSEKHASDVGRKTSFYEFFPESQHVRNVKDPNAAYLFTPFKKVDLYYAESMLRGDNSSRNFSVEGKMKKFFRPPLLDQSRVKITHPDFFRYIFTHFMDLKGHRPTTGALLVFAAMYLCDEVTIYGFGYDPRFTVHYYDRKFINITHSPTGAHDIANERELWKKLHSEGVIKLFKRDL
ncbi:alpha-N-acetylgalactosaminide alpha-2,6-sialyltransferase 1-like [Amphiura filiformis]|uniref:alpha-N-acetylgalactosaminide alpha-2,6-sialyltransferase 1-like n=1 Tax=Amphiura filiformis TaxID=82378 RepID=UPI003B20B9A6